jgi:hypothetical protein
MIVPSIQHVPIDASDPDSKCQPDCPRCAAMVAEEEAALDDGPFGMGYSGSLGPEDVSQVDVEHRLRALERRVSDLESRVRRGIFGGRP